MPHVNHAKVSVYSSSHRLIIYCTLSIIIIYHPQRRCIPLSHHFHLQATCPLHWPTPRKSKVSTLYIYILRVVLIWSYIDGPIASSTDAQPILATEETETTTTTVVTRTRRVYITPSPSPEKPSAVKSPSLMIKTSSSEKSVMYHPSYTPFSSPFSPPSPQPRVSRHTDPPPLSRSQLSQPQVSLPQAPPQVPVVTVHPIPHPDEIVRPRPKLYIQGFYVVFLGRECGIFYCWYVDYVLYTFSLIDSTTGMMTGYGQPGS